MHALDWIAEHGRHLRSIGAVALRRELARPKGTCTWCGLPVAGRRQTWCSDACVTAFKERCDPGHILEKVQERDRGVCALCGLDTTEAGRLVKAIREHVRGRGGCLYSWQNRALLRQRQASLGQAPRRAGKAVRDRYWRQHRELCGCLGCRLERQRLDEWEADHVLPVVEGGGLCDLTGYRTLCHPCHARETAALARRRARAGKIEVPDLFAELVA